LDAVADKIAGNILKTFDPNQPRDDTGQWAIHSGRPMNPLSVLYPELHPDVVFLDDDGARRRIGSFSAYNPYRRYNTLMLDPRRRRVVSKAVEEALKRLESGEDTVVVGVVDDDADTD
jgi:hypothetical protein